MDKKRYKEEKCGQEYLQQVLQEVKFHRPYTMHKVSSMATFEMRWSESERGKIEEGGVQMRRL